MCFLRLAIDIKDNIKQLHSNQSKRPLRENEKSIKDKVYKLE
jgi:hypothetical protein